jgi:4a-hydroxytetrahydrobiopterin dehydratase
VKSEARFENFQVEAMTGLREYVCIPCRGSDPRLNREEIDKLLSEVPGWHLLEIDGVQRLQHVFKFKNFSEALGFTNRVGELAESQGHHPALLTEWGSVTVTWWTHVIKGLHRNDFIMAARTDQL